MALAEQNPKKSAGLAFLAAAICLVLIPFLCLRAARISELAKTQQVAQARIVSLGFWDHGQTYDYIFTAGRWSFSGNSPAPGRGTYAAGQIVPVYYDRRDPAINSLGSFSWSLVPDGLPIALAACAAGGALIYGIRMLRRPPASA